jgi:ribonuclease HI
VTPAVVAFIDGASRGNPGPASYGIFLPAAASVPDRGGWGFLGSDTNNVAEHMALLRLLEWAHAAGVEALDVRSDSQLLVFQVSGKYRVKAPNLQPIFVKSKLAAAKMRSFRLSHVYREHNVMADRLANHALDTRTTSDVAPLPPALAPKK